MTESVVFTKSKAFALRIVRLYKYLRERKESVIAKQMLRSGTSIGANIAESRYAQSKADFIAKLQIALKEAAETQYWLELLRDAELVDGDKAFTSICNDCTELLKLLVQMHRAFLWYNKNRCLLPRLYTLLVYAY
jgi:four helix bundle protein